MSATESQRPAPLELRSFIDRIPTMAWSALPDGSLDFVNQPFRDYVGLSPDQLNGSGWKSAVHREDIQQLETWWQNLRQSQEAGTTEVRLRRFDGSPRWFLIFANPVRDESGNLIRWYGTNLDIEDRKRADETLHAMELPWRQIVDNIPGLVATMDANGEVEFLNRQTLDYFGKTTEDLKNWALTDVIHPDDLPRIIQARISSLEEGRVYHVEHRCRRADGVYRWFQVRGLPVRDPENKITAWYLLLTDIDDRKRAEQKLLQSEADFRTIINNIPGFAHTMSPTGEVEFLNQQILEFFGKSSEELKDWTRAGVVHPDDLPHVVETFTRSIETGQNCEIELRCLRADGVYRWFQSRGRPVRNAEGQVTAWYFLLTDIDDRKRAEQDLERTQFYLGEGQRLAHMGSWAFNDAGFDYWSPELFQLHGLDPSCNPPTLEEYLDLVHPEDRDFMQRGVQNMLVDHHSFDLTHRIVRPDGEIRYLRCVGVPLAGDEAFEGFVGTGIDITEQEQLLRKLRQSEQDLRTMIDAIRHSVVVLAPDGTVLHANRVALDLTGLTLEEVKDTDFSPVYHPDEANYVREERRTRLLTGVPFDLEMRLLFKSGQYRWQLIKYNPLKDESGKVIRWYATATDIDDRKRVEETLRQSEQELRTITETIRQPITVLAADGTLLYANRIALDRSGLTMDEAKDGGFLKRVCHRDDFDRTVAERNAGLSGGLPFDSEMRVLFKDGQYRWQLVQYNPLKDESGQIIRWYGTTTDIDDRKKMEERLRNENLVLREEIDRSSMFEEIVGSSKPMSQLLKNVEKVAPSDSTVLILGETGTGKELIARALHRRSKRANRAFVKVNCAAIPQSLIASELFGHEKGAFTGALQRRVGRFEAANGGTLFLDEIGELPMETQIALLRVLQEREFERVGSNHPISVDVRLIAATNRDLPAAVAAGTFRQDLFYRLNVFPIDVPPLRERTEDIPLLVEYFVGRFAKEASKNIRHIGMHTVELLQEYNWPGNIRELQNVVERAVILCETDAFIVDESWLESESEEPSQREGLSALDDREVEMIEAALAETHGRISGPSGAAAKLGIPRQTLESKIRRLGIDKYGQKRPASK
jgi:formate hydrogenlyase transcriptional activator